MTASLQLHRHSQGLREEMLGFWIGSLNFPSVPKELELYLQKVKLFVSSEYLLNHITE